MTSDEEFSKRTQNKLDVTKWSQYHKSYLQWTVSCRQILILKILRHSTLSS